MSWDCRFWCCCHTGTRYLSRNCRSFSEAGTWYLPRDCRKGWPCVLLWAEADLLESKRRPSSTAFYCSPTDAWLLRWDCGRWQCSAGADSCHLPRWSLYLQRRSSGQAVRSMFSVHVEVVSFIKKFYLELFLFCSIIFLETCFIWWRDSPTNKLLMSSKKSFEPLFNTTTTLLSWIWTWNYQNNTLSTQS
jgi:hypothetical protein